VARADVVREAAVRVAEKVVIEAAVVRITPAGFGASWTSFRERPPRSRGSWPPGSSGVRGSPIGKRRT
jgi:hypothetical protein